VNSSDISSNFSQCRW